MGTAHLQNEEASKKIKELAESIDFAFMGTALDKQPIHAIPMSTKKVDQEGKIWFLSGKDSDHNRHIQENPTVQLFYAHKGDMEFLTVFGKAVITEDRQILEDLYGKSDDMWFKGLDDPNLSALSVTPEKAHYWDSKHNKLVSLFKIAAGMLSGDQPDISVEGDLKA